MGLIIEMEMPDIIGDEWKKVCPKVINDKCHECLNYKPCADLLSQMVMILHTLRRAYLLVHGSSPPGSPEPEGFLS
jgi:hypothetical protein